MAVSAFTIEQLLTYAFGKTLIVWPTMVHIGFFFYITDPGPYLRIGISVPPPVYFVGVVEAGNRVWQMASPGRVVNRMKLEFGVAPEDWEPITHLGLAAVDASGNYAMTAWGPLGDTVTIEKGQHPVFTAGALGITLI